MVERDMKAMLAAYVERGRAEISRLEQVGRQRAATVETPIGYLLASEAQEKYQISYRRLRAWVRVGRVHVIRGRNARGLFIFSYNEVDIARAKRENPSGPVIVWEPEPITGITIESPRRRRIYVPDGSHSRTGYLPAASSTQEAGCSTPQSDGQDVVASGQAIPKGDQP